MGLRGVHVNSDAMFEAATPWGTLYEEISICRIKSKRVNDTPNSARFNQAFTLSHSIELNLPHS